VYSSAGFTQTWNASSMNHSAVNTGSCSVCHPASAAYYTFASSVNVIGALTPSYSGTGVTFPWHTGTGGTPTTDCAGCHSSFTTFGGASGNKPTGHVGTTATCNTCHNNPSTFAGQGVGWVISHAALTTPTACNSCHTGQTFPTGVTPVAKGTSPPHITVLASLQCSACHNTANNTTTFANVPTFTAAMHTANGNGTTGCNVCHNNVPGVAKVFQGVSPKPLPSGHITTTQACELCHTNTTTFAGQSTGWTMSHTGNTQPCSSCHNGQTFATGVTPMNTKSVSNHIPISLPGGTVAPTGNIGYECSYCHTSTVTGGFVTDKMNHGTMQGGTNPNGCVMCHNSTANYLGKMQKKTVGNHENSKSTDDCSKSGCHAPLGNRGKAYSSWGG
jgi:hypothetical protein